MRCRHPRLEPRPRLPGRMRCADCAEPFPCDETTCGHIDCMSERADTGQVVTCHRCHQPVDHHDPEPNIREGGGQRRQWFVENFRGRPRVAHSACLPPLSPP